MKEELVVVEEIRVHSIKASSKKRNLFFLKKQKGPTFLLGEGNKLYYTRNVFFLITVYAPHNIIFMYSFIKPQTPYFWRYVREHFLHMLALVP